MPLLGYEIYWNGLNTSGVNYTLLASVNPTIASYNISTVVPGYTYRFKLIAMNQVGKSPLSEFVIIKAAQVPDAPAIPTLVNQGPTAITISWLPPNNNFDALLDYKVYWD